MNLKSARSIVSTRQADVASADAKAPTQRVALRARPDGPAHEAACGTWYPLHRTASGPSLTTTIVVDEGNGRCARAIIPGAVASGPVPI